MSSRVVQRRQSLRTLKDIGPAVEWTPLPGLPRRANPCLSCPPIAAELPLDAWICVGFGSANVTCDERIVWEYCEWAEVKPWTCGRAERLAARHPGHDWRIHFYGPLHGESYQRQGPGRWVLIRTDEGFA